MSDRFINVFSLTPNLHTAGCPIIVEAGALLKDTETGNMIAQLKMKNIGEETIVSCKVSLKAFENNGAEVEGVKDYSYLDLSAAAGEEFGGKTPMGGLKINIIEHILKGDPNAPSYVHDDWTDTMVRIADPFFVDFNCEGCILDQSVLDRFEKAFDKNKKIGG